MFNPVAAWAVKACFPAIDGQERAPRSVLEFGNQRFAAGSQGIGNVTTTKGFYNALGFTEYVALDVNKERDGIVADLNEPLAAYDLLAGKQFDLVTNNGTGEHLFNQGQVFAHAHRFCKVGGVMLHILPTGGGWTNHGFYCYEPIIFRDIVAANDYSWVKFALTDRAVANVKELPVDPKGWPFKEKRPTELRTVLRSYGEGMPIYLVAAFRRTSALPFATPMQGKYLKDIDDPTLADRYRRAER